MSDHPQELTPEEERGEAVAPSGLERFCPICDTELTQNRGRRRRPTQDVRFPVKLNDAYTCQGADRDGERVVFGDLLSEGDRVASVTDEDGNTFGPFGVVVRRSDGLWIEMEPVS